MQSLFFFLFSPISPNPSLPLSFLFPRPRKPPTGPFSLAQQAQSFSPSPFSFILSQLPPSPSLWPIGGPRLSDPSPSSRGRHGLKEFGRRTPCTALSFLARTPRPGPRPYISAAPALGTPLQLAPPPFAPNPSSRATIAELGALRR